MNGGLEAEQLKDCIREVLAERATVDTETHRDHHESLGELLPELRDFLAYRAVRMQQIANRKALWAKIRSRALESSVGAFVLAVCSGVIAGLCWLGAQVIQAIIHSIQHMPPGGG